MKPAFEHENSAEYWRKMYADQLRRKRELHVRFDRLYRSVREVVDVFDEIPSVCEPHCAAVRRLRVALDWNSKTGGEEE